MFIIACAPGVSETYSNVKQILESLDIFDGADSLNLGSEFSLHTDLKEWNSILGLSTHAATYPCTWCEANKEELGKGARHRNLGRIRQLASEYHAAIKRYEELKARGGEK